MRKRRLLFVVTSDKNMGDLAFCHEWAKSIGREDFEYCTVLGQGLRGFADPRDACIYFEKHRHVRETVREAAEAFQPAAILFATNSFWNMDDQAGAEVGFFDHTLTDLRVPLLSLDVYEGEYVVETPWTAPVSYPVVPDYVWALRMMSCPRAGDARNVRYFCMAGSAHYIGRAPDPGLFQRHGVPDAPYRVLFPVSRDRYHAIQGLFYDYFEYLAKVFEGLAGDGVQILALCPEPVPQFARLDNVVHVAPAQFEEFMQLVTACDGYMTDSIISAMLHAVYVATPTLAMVNTCTSFEQLPPQSRAMLHSGWLHEERGEPWDPNRQPIEKVYVCEKMFPCMVFPYGQYGMVETLLHRYGLQDTFKRAEMFDYDAFQAGIYDLVTSAPARAGLIARCEAWRTARLGNPSPRAALLDILEQPLLF